MAACSDPTLEPGPVEPLDLGTFGDALEPPQFGELAQAYTDNFADFLTGLDAAFALLTAEEALELGGSLANLFGSFDISGAAPLNDEAIGWLTQAANTYAILPSALRDLYATLPPDANTPDFPTVTRPPRTGGHGGLVGTF
jgi:hypothetical protein